jgi:hypothetical protein
MKFIQLEEFLPASFRFLITAIEKNSLEAQRISRAQNLCLLPFSHVRDPSFYYFPMD